MHLENSTHPSVLARCRLTHDFNAGAICSLIAACLLLVAFIAGTKYATTSDWLVLVVIMLGLLLLPAYWLLARSRGAIRCDANGVQWRTAFGGWHRANWDEIEAWDARVTSSNKRWKYVVQTRKGAFSWIDAFTHSDELGPCLARFCPTIPASVGEWPRRFTYRGVEQTLLPLGIGVFGAWLLAALWIVLASGTPLDWWQSLSSEAANEGWLAASEWALVCVLATLASLALPAIFFLLYFQSGTRYYARSGESFVATSTGLTWNRKDKPPFFVAWNELKRLHFETRGSKLGLPVYRLETARGELNWENSLNGLVQFHRTLREYAPQLEEIRAPHLAEELSSQPQDMGASLCFNYKTRTLRCLIGLAAFLVTILASVIVFNPGQEERTLALLFSLIFLEVLLGAGAIWLAVLFARGTICLTEQGIEWKLPFYHRLVSWESIDALTIEERQPCLRIGKTSIHLMPTFCLCAPAHWVRLLEEIESRAVNAKGSWRVQSKQEP